MGETRAAVTVVVISDYGGRSAEDWNYLRDTLRGVARQAFAERVEVLLVDSTPPEEEMPPDVPRILADMRVIADGETVEQLDTAFRTASADLVAILDGDCAPVPGWLDAAVGAMRANPDAAAVSGRTTYPNTSLSYRILATLSRAFLDTGRPGRTLHITGNNAIFRRDVLLAHPLRRFRRPLAMRLQAEAIRLAGCGLYFEPRMHVTHRFEGWRQERRIRRHVGYRAVRVRQLDPRVGHAWMVRLGVWSIPLILAGRTLDSWRDCVRAGRHYGLRWFEVPAALAAAVAVHVLEIDGMRAAFAEARTQAAAS